MRSAWRRSLARHFESPLEGRLRSLKIVALPHRGEGKIDSVDVMEFRGTDRLLPEARAEFIVGMWCSGSAHLIFLSYIVRLLSEPELPDRAADSQTAQVCALWVGDAPGTQVACKPMQGAPVTNLKLF